MWGYELDRAGSGQGQVADICECGNEPSGSIKCGEFLDQPQIGQLLKKDSAPLSKYAGYFPKHLQDFRILHNTGMWGELRHSSMHSQPKQHKDRQTDTYTNTHSHPRARARTRTNTHTQSQNDISQCDEYVDPCESAVHHFQQREKCTHNLVHLELPEKILRANKYSYINSKPCHV